MSDRLFKVDLSDGARDFQPTATEPGLAMLDRNNANYSILRRWLGDYVAEPEWVGQDVHFYVRLEDRGRLENVHCIPCTKADLLGPLQESLEEMDEKLRKSKPETANEQLLHRIIRKKFSDLTRDYDSSDFHSHFFKYREPGQPWRLVWCWGYQRTDVEPANSLICANPECEALYERRPKQKARCPVCSSVGVRGKKPPAPLWVRVANIALLLLLLLGGVLFFLLNRPRLVASPDAWAGPPGSRVEYDVHYKRWFFLDDDVTELVVPQSNDKRIVRFELHGAQAKARAQGNTFVTFRYKSLAVDSTVHVGPPKQPEKITLEPGGDLKLAIGSTRQLTLWGHYDEEEELDSVDLTELAEWESGNDEVLFVHQGKLEGATEGYAKVTARYRANEKEKFLDAATDVTVTKVDYQSIELAVEPKTFGMGQSGSIEVFGLDEEGNKYSLLGSSLLQLNVQPPEVAEVEGDYLVGKKKGTAQLAASLLDLHASTSFEVGESLLAAGTFVVTPSENVKLYVDEYLDFDVISASSQPIEAVSSDPSIVEVIGPSEIAGRKAGVANVTLTQGGQSRTVQVTVGDLSIASLHIEPAAITLASGVPTPIRVYARSADGKQIDVSPDRIAWVKQPPLTHAELDRDSLMMFGVTPSSESFPLVAQLGDNTDIQAHASVKVVASQLAVSTSTVTLGGDEFLVYPPVSTVGRRVVLNAGAYLGDDLAYSDGGIVVSRDLGPDSVLYQSGLPPGTMITGIDGYDFRGKSLDQIRTYFSENPVVRGAKFTYQLADGSVRQMKLGETGVFVQEVRLVSFEPQNLTPMSFNASLTLELREEAEYRITNSDGEPLNDWQKLGPNAIASMATAKISRTPDNEYELFIERRIGDSVRRYQLPFTLTTMTTP